MLLALSLVAGCRDPARPEAVWCANGTGPAQVIYPESITYDEANDVFYILDRTAHLQRLDHDGRCLADWWLPKWPEKPDPNPAIASDGSLLIPNPAPLDYDAELRFGPDGNIWIADGNYHRVEVCAPDGTLIRKFGSPGTGDGQFLLPTDVGFDHGRVYISEYGGNDRVQVFDMQGKKLFQFGRFGSGDGEFSRPQTMVFDHGRIYITDACNHRIDVFDTDGKWIRSMGSPGSGLGEFRFPYGLAEDRSGHLIVSEFGNNRVQMIDKETGRGLKIWGSTGREPGQFAYPWGVVVDRRGRIIAADAGNDRLQVFEF